MCRFSGTNGTGRLVVLGLRLCKVREGLMGPSAVEAHLVPSILGALTCQD